MRAVGRNLFWCVGLAALLAGCAAAEQAPPVPSESATPPAPSMAPSAGDQIFLADSDPMKVLGTPPSYPVFLEGLDTIKDGFPDQDEAREIDPVAYELMRLIRRSPQELLDKSADPKLEFENLMRESENAQWRGHVASLNGVFREVHYHKLPDGNYAGLKGYWFGIFSLGKNYLATFISIEPLPEELKPGMAIEVTGIYMKRYAFGNRMPGAMLTWAPLLVIRHVEPIALIPDVDMFSGWRLYALIGMSVVLLLVLATAMRSRQTKLQRRAIRPKATPAASAALTAGASATPTAAAASAPAAPLAPDAPPTTPPTEPPPESKG